MSTITVRHGYCPEHAASSHVVDENEHHIANDTAEMKAKGYFYLRHIGGPWFSYRQPQSLPLDWQMRLDADLPEHDPHLIEPDF